MVYVSFDDVKCLTLMEGIQQANWPHIAGKVMNYSQFHLNPQPARTSSEVK